MGIFKDVFTYVGREVIATSNELAMMKSNGNVLSNSGGMYDPKASLVDPLGYHSLSAYGYKEKYSLLDYSKLRQISFSDPIVAAILTTRINQVASFTVPQRDKYKIGFKISLRDKEKSPNKAELKKSKELQEFILNCGVPESFEDTPETKRREKFVTFLRKTVRDSLVYDQMNFEITPRRNGLPHSFFAVDASTIRLVPDKKEREEAFESENKSDYKNYFRDILPQSSVSSRLYKTRNPRYVQVVNGIIKHDFDESEMAFGTRNPRTDLLSYGYGFCLHPYSRVKTTEGLVYIKDLAHKEDFEVCVGDRTSKARAYKTGKRKISEIHFEDGRILKASKDHRVFSLNDNGHFDWKRVEELSEGDIVASDISELKGGVVSLDYDFIPLSSQRAKPWSISNVGEDLFEIIGWLVGDGNYRVRKKGNGSSNQYGRCVSLFYNSEEEDICDKHIKILEKYNLPHPKYSANGDCFEIKFNHEGFGVWLEDIIGYPPSVEGIPDAMFTLPSEYRCAFLLGLFSADGTVGQNEQVSLGCTSKILLEDVQRILLSLGIRTRWTSGFESKDLGYGRKLYKTGYLYVYDRIKYFEKIGFYQKHKQLIYGYRQGTRADVVGESFGRRCAEKIKNNGLKDRRIRGLLEEPARWGVTKSWLKERLPENCSEMDDMKWDHSKVKKIIFTDNEIEMYDIEVFDDFHQFTVDGIVVHNSELEMLLTIVTSHMNAETYNRKFFTQGSGVKGVMAFEGGVPRDQLEGFRRQWHQQVSGVHNYWKTPIMSMGNDTRMHWVDLQKTNREMEYGKWLEYCIKTICGVFQIDPLEIGFDVSKIGSGDKGSSGGLGDSDSVERVTQSKDKGLRPLLSFIASMINEYVIYRIDPDFEFEFVGLVAKSEKEEVELDKVKTETYLTVNETRAKNDLEPLPNIEDIKSLGDMTLNANLISMVAQSMQGVQQEAIAEKQFDRQQVVDKESIELQKKEDKKVNNENKKSEKVSKSLKL